MTNEMKAFLLEIADLLEKHEIKIWACSDGDIGVERHNEIIYLEYVNPIGAEALRDLAK